MRFVIALDVSKGKSTIVIYKSQNTCVFEGEVNHTRTDFEWLHQQINEITATEGRAPEIIFEATGIYSKAIEKFLIDHNHEYCRMNPLEANLQMTKMRRNKTDISDAHELAKTHYNMIREHTYQQGHYYEKMRTMTRYYDEITEEIILIQNRMQSILHLSFPELEQHMTLNSALFLNFVQLYPHPSLLLSDSKTIIKNRLINNTRKNLSSKRAENKAIELLEAAKNSYPAINSTDFRCNQVRDYASRIIDLFEKKTKIVQEMVSISESKKEYKILRSIPGIGEATACRLIGELGDINRFKNAKQINAYVGIDVMRYQSGKLHYRDRINKRGNNRLRKILYFMICAMLMAKGKPNHFVDYYYKLKKQPQYKPHKVAVVACINKFLKVTFQLITREKLYDYEMALSNSKS